MCYTTSVKTTGQEIAKALRAPFPRQDEFVSVIRVNGFSHPLLPVLSVDNGRSISLYRWGLIPFWVKDWSSANTLAQQTLNAVSETVFEKPSFRDSIMTRRCVIPVTGFYEWKHVGSGKSLKKIPYFIHPKEHEFFYLMGLYSFWTDPATRDQITSFTILTGPANELMTDIHNTKKRQPLMIDRELVDTWIDPSLSRPAVVELMQPCDDRLMAAYEVKGEDS